MRTANAIAPGHVTGLFRIYDSETDPQYCGSTGAGFSIKTVTHTEVRTRESDSVDVSVSYNKTLIDAPVTETVINRMLDDYGVKLQVEVHHETAIPIGVGFGASGAGALGTALSLSSILDEDFDAIRAASYAHLAEVSNHTGLGDVIAQFYGGIEVRTKPGAPGIGEVMRISQPDTKSVVLSGATGLETKSVLTNPSNREKIIRVSERLIDGLIDTPSFDNFISASREFAEKTGLMSDRVKKALHSLDDSGFTESSMVMLGDSVFCFCESEDVPGVVRILSEFWDKSEVLTTEVSELGGRLV